MKGPAESLIDQSFYYQNQHDKSCNNKTQKKKNFCTCKNKLKKLRNLVACLTKYKSLIHKNRASEAIEDFFSSPEPKAQGELIVWDSSRRP